MALYTVRCTRIVAGDINLP